MAGSDIEREEENAAAAEAAAIGGPVSSDPPPASGREPDEARRPLDEAGEGESEGFEEAERELMEHASHGDMHAARRVIEDAPDEVGDPRAAEDGEGDAERSSELDEDAP